MQKAKPSHRIGAIAIDLLIVIVTVLLITPLFLMVFEVKAPAKVELNTPEIREVVVQRLDSDEYKLPKLDAQQIDKDLDLYVTRYTADEWAEYLETIVNDEGVNTTLETKITDEMVTEFMTYYERCDKYFDDYSVYMRSIALIVVVAFFVIFTVYFTVLGYLWDKQTIGRSIFKIKVLTSEGQKPSYWVLLFRDLVGFALFNLLNICMFVPIIINAISITGKEQSSIGDIMSKTMMVSTINEE